MNPEIFVPTLASVGVSAVGGDGGPFLFELPPVVVALLERMFFNDFLLPLEILL